MRRRRQPYVARQVAQKTRLLAADAAGVIDAKAARYAPALPWGRLEPEIDAAILAADPEQARVDAEAARDRQGVWVGRDVDHGYKKMFIRAGGPDVEALDTAIEDIAAALEVLGDGDSLDLRRAKAVGVIASTQATLELFTAAAQRADAADGGAPAPPYQPGPTGAATVYVHLAAEAVAGAGGVARVEELGPVLHDQPSELLGARAITVKPVIDLNDNRSVDGYEVPDWLAEHVHLRGPADCFPYSSSTRRRGDSDHTDPYRPPGDGGPPGQTTLANIGKLLRFHHRVKTHGRWKVVQLRSGIWLWRSPHGFCYLVDGAGTTDLGRI